MLWYALHTQHAQMQTGHCASLRVFKCANVVKMVRGRKDEAQIRELDSKYGNLVSMIQGLGHKHQPMLPPEPEDDEEEPGLEPEDAAKVRQWASSVSPAPADALSTAAQGGDAHAGDDEADGEGEDERQPHFARPLREIRVGESPSRPWGISVPARYLEKVADNASETSSQPARITSSHYQAPPQSQSVQKSASPAPVAQKQPTETKGRCPMGFDAAPALGLDVQPPELKTRAAPALETNTKTTPNVTFVAPNATTAPVEQESGTAKSQGQMLFTGPVFIGYSAEDAAKILRDSGLGGR